MGLSVEEIRALWPIGQGYSRAEITALGAVLREELGATFAEGEARFLEICGRQGATMRLWGPVIGAFTLSCAFAGDGCPRILAERLTSDEAAATLRRVNERLESLRAELRCQSPLALGARGRLSSLAV